MKLRKWMAMLLAGAVCVGMMAGCGSSGSSSSSGNNSSAASDKTFQGELTLILAQKDEYLSYLDQASKASAEAKGCTLTTVDCGEDMDKQIEYVKAAVSNKDKAIIVNPVDVNRAGEIVDAAGDIPVVFVNRTPADTSILDDTHIYVGSDETTSGVYQGQALVDYYKSAGKDSITYLMFKGIDGHDSTTNRSAGVLQALKDGGITATAAADPVTCNFDRTQAMDQMTLMIANGLDMSKVDCIISNNDAMAMGVIESLKQNQIDTTNIQIVGVDGTNAGLQAVENGQMLATVYQNAIGQATASVQAAINLAGGQDATKDITFDADKDNASIIWVPFELITADNVGDYY